MNEQQTEQMIQDKGKTAPRVTPADVDAAISATYYFTAAEGVMGGDTGGDFAGTMFEPLGLLTFCVLVLRNGFTVTGEYACASPENFDAEIARKIAKDNARAKIWPLLGYALRDKLAGES